MPVAVDERVEYLRPQLVKLKLRFPDGEIKGWCYDIAKQPNVMILSEDGKFLCNGGLKFLDDLEPILTNTPKRRRSTALPQEGEVNDI